MTCAICESKVKIIFIHEKQKIKVKMICQNKKCQHEETYDCHKSPAWSREINIDNEVQY